MAREGNINWYGDRFLSRMNGQLEKAISTAAIVLEADIKTHFTLRGAGRLYRKRKGIYHRASLPGQPPAIDTGLLRASIQHEVLKSRDRVTGRAGTNVDYGRYLELGTSRMAPRPYLRPALDRVHRQVVEMLKR